ncbi:MAG: carboxypeptidase-like regulatory domain-containing protein, partial [Pyrinomonadaceae bacterium]
DPSVLVVTADPATTAGTISSEMAFAVNPFTPGILRVAVYGAYPLSGQGVLLNLHFHTIGSIGSSSALTWQEVLVNEGNPANVATNGRITIAAPTLNEVTISGYVRNAGGDGIPFTHVILSSSGHNRSAVRTDAEGHYIFNNVNPGQAYTVAVGRRLYGFTPMIVNVTNSLSNVDLIARP